MNKKIKKKINLIIKKVDKIYGKGSIINMDKKIDNIEVISSGSINLNIALGIFGYPKGRIIEIFGPESSGKTTLALHVISESQKNGGICSFIDAEHAFDPLYANKIGINIKKLILSQPDYGEQALDITDKLIKSGIIDVIVIDSVAALTPKKEIDGEIGDVQIGLQARLMSQALRKLTSNISKTKSILIFINQLRSKIGVIFGSSEVTTGGNALKFYASIRLDVRRISQIKNSNNEIIGNRTRVKIIKNKMAPPFKFAEFDILYGLGISKYGEILDLGVELNIINKNSSWFNYKNIKLGHGRESAINRILNNKNLYKKIYNKIFDNIKKKNNL